MPTVFTTTEKPFECRLAETIAWCSSRASSTDPKRSLRSELLEPWVLAPDRIWTVAEVARKREFALDAVQGPAVKRIDLLGGRLLVYFPEANLADGAAELESRGLFDVNNTPPWDAWVALGTEARSRDPSYATYLIAWIPSMLLEFATAGVEANPEGCIGWLDDSSILARDELQHFLVRGVRREP